MKAFLFYALTLVILVCSCTKDSLITQSEATVAKLEITEEVIDTLEKAKFNTDGVTTEIIDYPDGTSKAMYVLEGDIHVSPELLESLTQNELHNRQFSTHLLVDNNQTLKVLGWRQSGNASSLSGDMRTALKWAINNYNNLDIGLDFELTYGSTSDFSQYDIVVFQVHNNRAGGSAGFPHNGAPHKWVRIFNLTEGYDTNVIEHVITHEIGHTLGLRHTDWFSRQSCGSGSSGESVGNVGANYIPGTQPAYDPNSVMLACFDTDEDGEFGFYDRVALEFLY